MLINAEEAARVVQIAYNVVLKIHDEIDKRQTEAAGQAFYLSVGANADLVWIDFIHQTLWDTEDENQDNDFSAEKVEKHVRMNLAELVETIKKIEGVG